MRFISLFIFAFSSAREALAATDLSFNTDGDLTSFVTRPEIKVPLLNITFYDRDATLPGKWFLAPYVMLKQQQHAEKVWQPCQIGPAIYAEDGELVWSGACSTSRNQNTYDFRLVEYSNTYTLTAVLGGSRHFDDPKGHGVVMDSSYNIRVRLQTPPLSSHTNMHELQYLPSDDGGSIIQMLTRTRRENIGELQIRNVDDGWITDTGFREVHLKTGRVLFEWWPTEHVSLLQGTRTLDGIHGPYPTAYQWFHANSVNKNTEGDFLVSSRWTDAIYKISGIDGSLLWTLGGKLSDFVLDGFNFSRQHDAQWISVGDDTEVISFLDNGSDGNRNTSKTSSALIVSLDKASDPPRATVMHRIWRPDGGLSGARGNFQRFDHSDNVVIGWSGNAYISEHDGDGRLLLEGSFLSDRMVTYRSYKFNFTGVPSEPIAVKSFIFGSDEDISTTVVYVSWNGATEVCHWNFYGGSDRAKLGRKRKTGFETMHQARGAHRTILVEGVNCDGEILGTSEATRSTSYLEEAGSHGKSQVANSRHITVPGYEGKTEL